VVEIVKYDESYSLKVRESFQSLWLEIQKHGDVLKDTINIAVEGDRVLGVCFLLDTPSCECADKEHPGYLNMEFEAILGEEGIEISAMLIDALIDEYQKICEANNNKRLILRTFCPASSVDYIGFLSSFGFRAQYFMYRMKKDLSGVEPMTGDGGFSFTVRGRSGREEKIEVKAIRAESDGSIADRDEYFEANGSAFGIPDSKNELVYRLREQNGVQFTAKAKGKVVAAVSVWENGHGSVSTENIFCIKEYRRLGITEKLLRGVCAYLSGKGYREASLYVFGVNNYAVGLYTKLGYNIYGGTLHMLYEDDYVPELI